MKKVLYMVLLCILALCFMIPCGATLAVPDIESYKEYEKHVAEQDASRYFVHYERLAFLGDFVSYHPGYWDGVSGFAWEYTLEYAKNRQICVLYYPAGWSAFFDKIPHAQQPKRMTMEDVADVKDMRMLKNAAEIYEQGKYFQFIDAGSVAYLYYRGFLRSIYCKDSRNAEGYYCFFVEQEGSSLADYPYRKRDLISRLLDYNTAPEALEEFESRIEGTYVEPPGKLQVAISGRELFVGAISGAVLAGVGAWLITFLVMRKKSGAPVPAPAMAGVPVGEVSAGSDGNVSDAPSGAAPAAPKSLTPPEAAATEDMAAEDTAPEETPPPEG